MKKIIICTLALFFATACQNESMLNSFNSNISYEEFCNQYSVTCEEKRQSDIYPTTEEFQAALKVVTAMGTHGSNGISFTRDDLDSQPLSRAVTRLGLQDDFAKMKSYFDSTNFLETVIDRGVISIFSSKASTIKNKSGLIIDRDETVTIKLQGGSIIPTGMKLGSSSFAKESITQINYTGNGEISIALSSRTITGIPMQVLVTELFPFVNFSRVPAKINIINAIPDLATWFFDTKRQTILNKEFFAVLSKQLPLILKDAMGQELAKIMSVVDQAEMSEGSPFFSAKFDDAKDLECEMQAGNTPKSYMQFKGEYEGLELVLERPGRLRFESTGIPTQADIFGSRLPVNTSRLIFKENGVELRKVPVLRKIHMNWADLLPPNLKFRCYFKN